MDDLVTFLRARLDEDEQVARGSGQPSLSWQNFDMDGELRDDANAGTVAAVPQEETRAHIARHDPARVLREVEAKRGVVRQYEGVREQARHPVSADNRMRARVAQGELGDVLRLLALPYADHPDHRSEWRP